MSKLIKEVNELIATRIPPGDRWSLVNDVTVNKVVYTSLTDTLEAYFLETKFKGSYKLSPLENKLYAIKTVVEEVVPPEPKAFNIYGDPV